MNFDFNKALKALAIGFVVSCCAYQFRYQDPETPQVFEFRHLLGLLAMSLGVGIFSYRARSQPYIVFLLVPIISFTIEGGRKTALESQTYLFAWIVAAILVGIHFIESVNAKNSARKLLANDDSTESTETS